jgi:hypothetical protein
VLIMLPTKKPRKLKDSPWMSPLTSMILEECNFTNCM